jgi:hypothetical protein
MLSQRMSAYVSIRQRMREEASGGLRCSRSVSLSLDKNIGSLSLSLSLSLNIGSLA